MRIWHPASAWRHYRFKYGGAAATDDPLTTIDPVKLLSRVRIRFRRHPLQGGTDTGDGGAKRE